MITYRTCGYALCEIRNHAWHPVLCPIAIACRMCPKREIGFTAPSINEKHVMTVVRSPDARRAA